MSTKTTIKYAEIKNFKIHVYDDFSGSPGVSIRINDASASLSLTRDELDSLVAQLNE